MMKNDEDYNIMKLKKKSYLVKKDEYYIMKYKEKE